jgi:hypothetical protein
MARTFGQRKRYGQFRHRAEGQRVESDSPSPVSAPSAECARQPEQFLEMALGSPDQSIPLE